MALPMRVVSRALSVRVRARPVPICKRVWWSVWASFGARVFGTRVQAVVLGRVRVCAFGLLIADAFGETLMGAMLLAVVVNCS